MSVTRIIVSLGHVGFAAGLLAACGDNPELAADAALPTADTAVVDAMPAPVFGYAVAGDFTATGTLARIHVGGGTVDKNLAVGAASADPQLRWLGDELIIVNRTANNVTVLDAATLAVKLQVSTGANSNPYDAAVVGDKIFVPALGSKGVLVITRSTQAVSEIDLSALDGDGKPDCNSALAVGSNVFVTCGSLDNAFTSQKGTLVVLNATSNQIAWQQDLPQANPFGQIVATPTASVFGGDLLVATADFTDQTKRCVVRLPVAQGPAASCAIQNADLGANPSALAVSADGTRLYLTPQQFGGAAPLRAFDLTAGTLTPGSVTASDQVIADVAACSDGTVIVADHKTGAAGLRLYKNGSEVTAAPLDIGIKPIGGGGLACR